MYRRMGISKDIPADEEVCDIFFTACETESLFFFSVIQSASPEPIILIEISSSLIGDVICSMQLVCERSRLVPHLLHWLLESALGVVLGIFSDFIENHLFYQNKP